MGQIIRLASNLLMTRLLLPEMFGLMAIANVLIFGINMLSDFGLRQNIIQSARGHEHAFLNAAWTVKIIRGCLVMLLSWVAAAALHYTSLWQWWTAGSVYNDPLLPWIIAVLGITALIDGFESTKMDTASRQLEFKRITMIEIASQVAGIAFMLAWALVDRSVWALVGGALVADALRTWLSHVAMPGEGNRFYWGKPEFSEMFHFGKWIFLASVLGFLAGNGDRLLLGNLTDTRTLGLYAIAFLMWSAMREAVHKISDNVALPALSEIVRDRPHELKRAYYRFRLPIDILSLTAAGFFFATGDLIVMALYDDRYAHAGEMLQVLCVGFFAARYDLAWQCFIAMGKPKLVAGLTLAGMVVLYGFLPAGYDQFGISGALWAITLSSLVSVPLVFYYKSRFGMLDLKQELVVLPLMPLAYGAGLLVHFLLAHIRT